MVLRIFCNYESTIFSRNWVYLFLNMHGNLNNNIHFCWNKIPNESKTARVGFFKAHLQHYFMLNWAGLVLALLSRASMGWNLLKGWYNENNRSCLYDAIKKSIASLFSDTLEKISKMMQSSKIIASLFVAWAGLGWHFDKIFIMSFS